MAKKEKMVTRTFVLTEVNVLCLNVNTIEPSNIKVSIPGKYCADKLLDAVRNAVDTDTLKVVSIVESVEVEKLYGVPESVFLENAIELPSRVTKNDEV